MSTVKSVFEDTVKTFCGSVSIHLADWLQKNKSVEITAEEICNALEIPFRPPSTPGMPTPTNVQTVMPSMPNYFATTTTSPQKKRGGGSAASKKKKETDPNLPRCQYQMTRGDNKGKQCDNSIANDGSAGSDRFCKACLKKSAVQSKLKGPAGKDTVQAPTLPGGSLAVPPAEEQPQGDLNVIKMNDHPGLYREETHGFIVQPQNDGSVLVLHMDDGQGGFRALTENEKTIALGMGLIVPTDTAKVNVVNIPSVPSIPSVPMPKFS